MHFALELSALLFAEQLSLMNKKHQIQTKDISVLGASAFAVAFRCGARTKCSERPKSNSSLRAPLVVAKRVRRSQ